MKGSAENNIIFTLTIQFALEINQYCEAVEGEGKFVVGNPLLKSGTSIGAIIRGAQNAESKSDLIHKLKISAKDREETFYWLELCKFSKNYPPVENLLENLPVISRIINKIIISAKK